MTYDDYDDYKVLRKDAKPMKTKLLKKSLNEEELANLFEYFCKVEALMTKEVLKDENFMKTHCTLLDDIL